MAYVCVGCDNVFNSSRNLSRHDKEVHQKIRFSCSCGKDFARNLTLNKHLENCKVENNFSLNSNNQTLSGESDVGTQSLGSKINSNISQNMSNFSNHLSNSPDANDGFITDNEADSLVPRIRVKRTRKSKISHDSSDEVDADVVRKPLRKCARTSRKSQDGSGIDSKRLNDKMVNYTDKSDIFSKNKKYSHESDSEDNQSEVSDDNLGGGSNICYCRDCQRKSSKKNNKNQYIHSSELENQSEVSDDNESDSVESENFYCQKCGNKPSKKTVKNQYVHSNESDNQSESNNYMEIDMEKESDVKLETKPYKHYYESQALGGGIFSTIIGNPTRTGNVSGRLSSLYRSSFPIPKILGNAIFQKNNFKYGSTAPVGSYLN